MLPWKARVPTTAQGLKLGSSFVFQTYTTGRKAMLRQLLHEISEDAKRPESFSLVLQRGYQNLHTRKEEATEVTQWTTTIQAFKMFSRVFEKMGKYLYFSASEKKDEK